MANTGGLDPGALLGALRNAEDDIQWLKDERAKLRAELNTTHQQLRGAVDALRDLLDCTDHRSLNEQVSGGDECDCGPCVRARAIVGGR